MKLTLFTARRLASALALSLLASVSARADDHYVDAVGGSDSNGGTSPADAWQTITHALATVPGGVQTVHVAPGVYDAGLGESFPLALHSNVILVGDLGRDVTIVDGGGTPLLFDAGAATLSRVYGLWLRNADLGFDLEFEWGDGGQLILEDALLSGMQRGISGYVIGVNPDDEPAVGVFMRRSVIRDCTDVGVYLLAESWLGDYDWSSAGLDLEDSLIHGCGTGAAVVSDGHVESSASIFLDRSVIASNGNGCTSDYIRARRCTVHGSADRGLSAEAMTVENSIVYGNGDDLQVWSELLTVAYSDIGEGADGVGNISADPLFMDAANGDFRLRFWSPCTDAGDPALAPTQPDGDLDTVRGLDMGAFELAPLAVNGTPRVGQTFQLELWGPANGASVVYLSRGLPADPPFPTRFGDFELVRQRAALFDVGTTAPGPPGLLSVQVPDHLSLVGATFSLQALSTSSVSVPPQAWTNAVTVTIAP